MKTIVLTGGGSAGHVTPHLALLPELRRAGYCIHYIGTENGIERGMMEKEGLAYHAVKSGKLRRYFDVKNFTDPFRVIAGAAEAARLIGKIKPDVCFSKGGFVSVPVVVGAWLHRVPVVCHESDITPGLANRICATMATRIATTFPECAQRLGEKAEYTGTPMRDDLFTGVRARGLEGFGFTGQKPVLLMMGGSLGAQKVNAALRAALPRLLPIMDVAHICGKGNLDDSLTQTPGYAQREFMSDDLPDALACTDLVLSRAGANAICEFAALMKPMLLVPYPKGAGRGDQVLNAESYRARGFADVLPQEDMTPDTLYDALISLREHAPRLTAALKSAPPANGTAVVLALIERARAKETH